MKSKGDEDVLGSLRGINPTEADKQKSEKLENLAGQKKIDEYGRERNTRDVASSCLIALIILVFLVIASTIFTLAAHTLTPESWHWLTPDQYQDIKNFVLSGSMVGLAVTVMRKYF